MKKNIILLTLALMATSALAIERQKLNFNGGWLLEIGDFKEASQPAFDDSAWKQVTRYHVPSTVTRHSARISLT